jgi:hypothetical protein
MNSRRILTVALLAGGAALLAGCSTIQDAAGTSKESPDEFAVVTKAPLVIPPDFNLKPPAPGAEPTNQIEPTQAAQSALFSSDPATVAASMPTTMSAGERYLLAYAHAQDASPAIRQQIAADIAGARASDDSFTNSVLFWSGPTPPPGSTPVDADAEARRLDTAKDAGAATAAPASTPAAAPSSGDSDDDNWLDHLWPF